MASGFKKVLVTIAVSLFPIVLFSGRTAGEGAPERVLGPENVMVTHYALGGDTSGQKSYSEEVYVSRGTPQDALITLKKIVIEGERPARAFKMNDRIEIVVFRGVFSKLCKIGIKKVVLKDSTIEIYAEYKDFPDSNIASQPAAIITIGQLPPGKYTAILFVDSKLQKKAEFSVSR